MLLFAVASACNCGGRIEAITASVDVSPRALDFGVQPPGSVISRTVTVTAHGSVLRLDRVEVTGDVRGSFAASAPTLELRPGEPSQLTVSYAPTREGADSASFVLVLASEGLDDVTVPIVGRCLAGNIELDGGIPDAGVPDAGVPDAGAADAGWPVDAGQAIDAGTPHFDGGECPGTETYGYGRWPAFGKANLPELHWNGSDWVAFFHGSESWYGRVDTYGQAMPSTLQQVSPSLGSQSSFARAARGSSDWGVVYADDRGGSGARQVYFARVGLTGAVVPNSELPVTPKAHEVSAAIAFNPVDGQYGILYGLNQTVRFVRVTAAGALISGSERVISSSASSAFRMGYSRSVVWAGSNWAMVWVEPTAVVFAELDRNGDLIPSSRTTVMPISGTDAVFDPALVASPTQYGVVFQHNGASIATAMVRFARVNSGGGLVPNSLVALGGTVGLSGSADLVWDGNVFFVAFSQQVGAPGADQFVAFSTVSPAGQVQTLAKLITCGGTGSDFFPRVSWNGAVHAVAYARQYVPPGQTMSTQEGRVLLIP